MTSSLRDTLIVVGGGVTGLSVAFFAARAGKRVIVLEGALQVGGLLCTTEVNERPIEKFYHHFFTHDAELFWLLEQLNSTHLLEFKKASMGMYSTQKIYPFGGVLDLIRFKPLRILDKIRFIATTTYLGIFADWRSYESNSAEEWLKKWAGERCCNFIWRPLLKSKFGKYSHNIPVSWMVGRLQQRMRSRKKGKEQLGVIKGSSKELLKALEAALKSMGVELVVNAKVDQLKVVNNRVQGVKLVNGEEYISEDVVLTIPSPIAGKLVGTHDEKLAKNLQRLEYFKATCAIVELSNPLSNQYWLNIADQKLTIGGIIEQTNLVSQEEYNGSSIVYLSKYFTESDEFSHFSEEDKKQRMLEDLKSVFPDLKSQQILSVQIHSSNYAAPICELNFSERVTAVQSSVDGVYICNMQHVYPDERSINNAIIIAAKIGELIGVSSSHLPPKRKVLSGSIGFNKDG